MVRVVDRDVLVDSRFPKAHHETEDHAEEDEEIERNAKAELDQVRGAVRVRNALYDVGRLRVAHDEQNDQRDDKRHVHHKPRTPDIRHPAAKCPEDRARKAIKARVDARRRQCYAVGADIVARQEAGEGNKGSKDEEVVRGKTPDLDIPQRFKLHRRRDRLFAGFPLVLNHWVGFCEDVEGNRHSHQANRVDARRVFPADCDHKERRREVGHRRTDITGTKDTKRCTLPLGLKPARHVCNANDERTTRQAETQRNRKEHRVSLNTGQQPDRHRSDQHLQRQHDAAAVLVGPDAKEDPADRAGQNGCCNQQSELGFAQPQFLFDLNTDNRKNRPNCKANCKRQGT